MEAELKPVQGSRFQPTGFPDLGAAAYEAPGANGKVDMVLVESAQSMANRMEAVCWDEASGSPHSTLEGLPYVSVSLWDSGNTTNSILEAHWLNSPYIMRDDDFADKLRSEAKLPGRKEREEAGEFNRAALARVVFKYDPGSVLHGVFLEKLLGLARLQRCLSGFIEACCSNVADSGGVKNDRIAPSPGALRQVGLQVSAAEGYGNVPFHRTEYTAERITAYFNLDMAQIRAYGLGDSAERFLVTLALWKVRKFLESGLRLRTACDLDMDGDLEVTRPDGFDVPSTAELESDLPGLVQACAGEGLFADPPVTELTFSKGEIAGHACHQVHFHGQPLPRHPVGRHVNEGVLEWPPSPWRILRGIVATWRRTLPDIPSGRVESLLRELASEYPKFHLPVASTAHTRHYMPYNEGARERTTLVIDSFVAIQPGKSLFAVWRTRTWTRSSRTTWSGSSTTCRIWDAPSRG